MPLRPGDVAHDSIVELGLGDQGSPAAGGEQRRFVDDVGEVGAGEAGSPGGQRVEVHLTGQWLALGVQVEDLPAPGAERGVDGDLAVEAAGAQERGVEDVGPVGGRDDDHAVGGLEAVHLDQQLVERLLALVVAAADARAAVPADRVDLVDEDDRRRPLLGLAEEITHAARADADEHLDEVRSRDREERHIGFSATARASSVLPVPGGPKSSTPLGIRAPMASKRLGDRRNVVISRSSWTASSAPATSANVVFGASAGASRAGARRKPSSGPAPLPADRRLTRSQAPPMTTTRIRNGRARSSHAGPRGLTSTSTFAACSSLTSLAA